MKRCLAVPLVAVMALAAGVSRTSAHHSFAATYLEDQTVTVRHRDSMEQHRIPIADLIATVQAAL